MSRRKCKFTSKLAEEFPMFNVLNDYEIECRTCENQTKINIASKGRPAIVQHLDTDKHKKNVTSVTIQKPINQVFLPISSSEEKFTCAVEACLAFHTVKHNFSYNSTNCTHRLTRHLFRDSTVAQKVQSGKTKTEAIVNNVLAPYSVNEIKETLKQIKYISVATDASNHGDIKMFPIIIQYFNKEEGLVHKLIELKSLPNETSEVISKLVLDTLNTFKSLKKCIAFGGDNANTMFGGLGRGKNFQNNVFCRLKEVIKDLIGIGCPAHILNNAIHYAADFWDVDIDSILFKIYKHFSIYTVRVESLKDFCDNVEIDYKRLLSHSKTRWLSLFPVIERVLKMFEPLRNYFLTVPNSPAVLHAFFENPLNEAFLFFMHSLVSLFHCNIAKMEEEKNSLLETMDIVSSMNETLSRRYIGNFIPFSVKSIFSKNADKDEECNEMKNRMIQMYENARIYLQTWTAQFDEFRIFQWMNIANVPTYDDIEPSICFLKSRNIEIDDAKLFDQLNNLKGFIEKLKKSDKYNSELANEKWVMFFQSCNTSEQYSEFEKIAEFFFAIPSHNAVIERIFSMIKDEWTDKRNRLLLTSIKSITLVKFNLKDLDCFNFLDLILTKDEILYQVRNSDKYQKKKEIESSPEH